MIKFWFDLAFLYHRKGDKEKEKYCLNMYEKLKQELEEKEKEKNIKENRQ